MHYKRNSEIVKQQFSMEKFAIRKNISKKSSLIQISPHVKNGDI